MKIEDRYLGDGVYASFDGYQIWLAANDHTNKVIALESDVMRNLVDYTNDIRKAVQEAALTFTADTEK